MHKRTVFLVATALALVMLLAACAAGRDFARPSPGSLEVGKLTESEVVERYGEPWKRGFQVINDLKVQTLAYAYSTQEGSLVPGVTPARALDLMFHNNILVGRSFMSSFKSDHTDFIESDAKSLKEGQSCDNIAKALGPPPAEFIYPAAEQRDITVYAYSYPETRKSGLTGADHFLKRFSVDLPPKTGHSA